MNKDEMKQATLPVDGMHCPSCSANIEQSIAHLPGVSRANVNFAASELNVTYDSSKINLPQIKQAVEKRGYRVKETNWEKTRSFWQSNGLFIHMLLTGLCVIGSWLLITAAPVVSISLALIAVIIGGYPIYTGAIRSLLVPDLNVEVLITVAAIGSIAVGAYREAAMVILIMLIGETLEKSAVKKTHQAIGKLMQLAPATALVRRDSGEIEVAIEEVHINDIVIVKPGERIPVDGLITNGESSVNQSMLIGESIPVFKQINDKIYAGTFNESGSLEIKVTQIGERTQLANIKKLVLEAETEKAPIQRLADRFARYFIPIIVLISVAAYLISGNIYKSITILVASCPCALILAAPTAIVAGLGNAARKGILIKGGQYLELFGHLDTLLMDKTGTLTQGKITVTDIKALSRFSENDIIRITAAAEKRSEHPIARAILDYIIKHELIVPKVNSFEIAKGMGVIAKVSDNDEKEIRGDIFVGNPALMKVKNIVIKENIVKLMESMEDTGKTVLLVALNSELIGLIAVSDILRPDVANIINDIRKSGVKRIVLLTGDNQRTAKYIAHEAGIDEYYSGLLPEDKIAKLKEIKKTSKKVGMIGDGVNDAPALASADVGIAMGLIGSDVTIEAADVSLMQDDLSKIPVAIRLSRRVWNTIIQNFAFSIIYNIAMIIIIGLVVHEHNGITFGAIIHQISCLLVVLNSLRLLRG